MPQGGLQETPGFPSRPGVAGLLGSFLAHSTGQSQVLPMHAATCFQWQTAVLQHSTNSTVMSAFGSRSNGNATTEWLRRRVRGERPWQRVARTGQAARACVLLHALGRYWLDHASHLALQPCAYRRPCILPCEGPRFPAKLPGRVCNSNVRVRATGINRASPVDTPTGTYSFTNRHITLVTHHGATTEQAGGSAGRS